MLEGEKEGSLFVIMDYEPNGNLEDFMVNNPNISDSQIIEMFLDIL